MTKRVKLRRYSAEVRDRVVAMAGKVGPTAAGKELKIPSGTIANWQHQARHSAASSVAPVKRASKVRAVVAAPVSAPSSDVLGTSGKPASPVVRKTRQHQARHSGASAAAPVKRVSKVRAVVAPVSAPISDVPAMPDKPTSPAVPKKKVVAKVYTPSQRAQALELTARDGVKSASEKLGISRFSIHNWQRQVELFGQGALPTSPVVGSDENHAEARDNRILTEWKAHPGLGPSQVRNQMRRAGMKVSLHTVRCVLEAHGYVTPKVRRVVVHDQRYEAVRPNHLWHMDFLHRYNSPPIWVPPQAKLLLTRLLSLWLR